jgi:uncharacterized protein (DUF885 family)
VKTRLLLVVLATCTAARAESDSERLAAFLDRAYEAEMRASPMLATELGEKGPHDQWDDISPANQARNAARVRKTLEAARAQFDKAKLDPKSRLQYRVFLAESQLLLDRYRWRNHYFALNQIVGLHLQAPAMLINHQPLDTPADAEAYLRRLETVGPLFDQLIANMEAQAKKRIYMPKSVYPLLTEGARAVIEGPPEEWAIYRDFQRRTAAMTNRDALLKRCRAALVTKLQPAYEKLIVHLSKQLKATPVDGGVWQLPQGDEFYEFLIRQFTTTNMTPEEIHELGLQEVARTQKEMAAVLEKVAFTGTVKEFMAKVKADPQFYVSNDDAGRERYLARAREIVTAMEAKIPQAFLGPASSFET